jgi:hypothetical protein
MSGRTGKSVSTLGVLPRRLISSTSSVESRFEALYASGVTELVGREEELELLLRRWSKAKNGEGHLPMPGSPDRSTTRPSHVESKFVAL